MMKSKFMVALVVFSFVMISGSALASSGNPLIENYSQSTFSSAGTFDGNITIFANGTISPGQTGISHYGNVFELSSNIKGKLIFMASNSILNGNGYSVSDSYVNSTLLTVSNNSGSTVENLKINSSTNGTLGVGIINTTKDDIRNLTVSAGLSGIAVTQGVEYLNVSHSNFTVNSSNQDSYVSAIGFNISQRYSAAPKGLPGTGNITYYADNLVSLGASLVFLSVENYVSVEDSNFTSSSNKSFVNTISLSNYTVFRGDRFMTSSQEFGMSFGVPFAPNLPILHGNVFEDNSVIISANSILAIYAGSSTLINGNSFKSTKSDVSVDIAVFVNGSNTAISGNTFSKLQAGADIISSGNNVSITNNILDLSSPQGAAGIEGTFSNSTISENDIFGTNKTASDSGIEYGINVEGNNLNVISNQISMNGSSSSPDAGISLFGGTHSDYANYNQISSNIISIINSSATGILLGSGTQGVANTTVSGNTINIAGKEPNGIFYLGSNDTITGNNINISSTDSSSGIGSLNVYSGSSYDHITNNYIRSYLKASGSQFGLYYEYGLTDSVISGNQFTSAAGNGSGIELNGYNNHDSISSNTFTFPSGINSVLGLNLNDFLNGTLSNNSIYNTNKSLNWNGASHVVINGNYFYNQYTAMYLSDSNNLTFYQNDFVNFTDTLVESGEISNVSFNVQYPVGGNYWSNYTGSDKYAGPGQNIPGPDGIGDTPFRIAYNLTDKYPLMKPWTRPTATFTESGLSSGSSWSVQYDGKLYTSDQKTISFTLHDSTYQVYMYMLQNVSGYYLNTSLSVNFSYSGTGATYNIVYYHYAYLTGTVTPGQVTIKIGNSSYNITNGKFNFTLKAGTYNVEFIHSGYVTKTYQLTITAGEDKNLTVNLAKPSDLLYYAIGGIVAVVVVGGAAFVVFRKK